ncbi:MAG: PKD domain-containing protein [Salibacteraceae bacterium]
MKKFNSFLVLFIALLSTQWVSAQCNGTVSSSGSGATYTFTSTNPASAAQMHSWDFGDGTYGVGQTTSHTYTTSGTYTVIAIFGDSVNMCADYDTLFINAVVSGGANCSAAFSTSGNSPSFTFTTTGTPSAPPGYYSYAWSFGDGTVGSGDVVAHTYTANGTYNVTCILYDSIWCSDTVTNMIVVTGVGGPTCDASFTYSDSNGVYYFMASHPTATSTYNWTLSNGATYSGANPVVTINQPGTYTMCMDIYDANTMCSDSSCVTFTYSTGGGTCNAEFSYTNQGSTYSFTPNTPDPQATYSWTFGDGNSSSMMNPSHTYSQNGTYAVQCNLSTPSGCTAVYDTLVFNNNSGPMLGSISGVVDMGNTYADYGVVFLIANDTNGSLAAVDTATIDSMGMYYFSNVAYGTYLVKAALSPASTNFSSYLPTYHAVSATGNSGALLWSNASDVVLNVNYLNNINIDLISGTNAGGVGFIGGLVSQGANKEGDPISDINIMVLDPNGDPVSYTYSDNTGDFQVSGLANGTYTVYPEVEGRVTTPIDVVISDNNIGTNDIRVVVNSTTVEATIATGVETVLTSNSLNIYPNPVVNELQVDWNISITEPVIFVIRDITGKEIQRISSLSGTHSTINTSYLGTGIYILSVQLNGEISNFKFVK